MPIHFWLHGLIAIGIGAAMAAFRHSASLQRPALNWIDISMFAAPVELLLAPTMIATDPAANQRPTGSVGSWTSVPFNALTFQWASIHQGRLETSLGKVGFMNICSKWLGALGALVLSLLSLPAEAQWARKPDMPSGSSIPYLVENFSAKDWDASNFAQPEDVARLSWGTVDKAHRKMPDGDKLSDGVHLPEEHWVDWAKELKFQDFDAGEWVKQAQDAGFKYIIFTAKHHEGFHLWDTQLSDFKVTNSPFGRDMLGELIAACHRAGMPVGIYYSQRDWYRPTYQPTGFGKDGKQQGPEHQKYIDYQFGAVRELLTKYGKIDIFWWDALWWGGMFNKEMWDAERLTREVRRLQPHIVMNNRASVPGDFDTPEQRLGGFQNWRPFEAAVSLEDSWSYTGSKHKSASEVISLLVESAENNGNLLLSIGPKWSGQFDPAELATLHEVGQWLARYGTSIYGTRGGPWQKHPWGGATYRGATAFVHANSISGEKIEMEMPEGEQIRSVRMLSCPTIAAGSDAGLSYAINEGILSVHVPRALQDKIDTIVEIQFSQDLTYVAPIAYGGGDGASARGGPELSPFDYELVYGTRLLSGVSVKASSLCSHDSENELSNVVTNTASTTHPFSTDSQIGAQIAIELDRARYVTGISLAASAQGAPLELDGSVDGKTWTVLLNSTAGDPRSKWDIGVNDFKAGAETPGRLLRFLRIKVQGADPKALELRRLHIWAKEGK
jgi:alpha-L-fucosidase